ncbi:MAG: NAD(P)/FAD-dependent oxidoreductase [Anaerolineales bacterium]
MDSKEHFDTVVIGGGQAGLAMGHALRETNRDFVILEAHKRAGDSWRKRWDSLELFTTARDSSLPGLPFPAPSDTLPTKDGMAEYLELYAQKFGLPVQLNTRVKRVYRRGKQYIIETDGRNWTASTVVVATGAFPKQRIPDFAQDLSPAIEQLPSTAYRNRRALDAESVLVVGAGSSGAQIALDLLPRQNVWLAGRYAGYVPSRLFGVIDTFALIRRTAFRIPTRTRVGQKVKEKFLGGGAPIVDIRESDLEQAGIERVPRVQGVRGGMPLLADGRTLDPNAIIWATGYVNDFRWIDLPVFDEDGLPLHNDGAVEGEPGLYFLGLPFMIRGASGLISGVGEDAALLAAQIERRAVASKVSRAQPLAVIG